MEKRRNIALFLLLLAWAARADSLIESGTPSPAFWVVVAVGGVALIGVVVMISWWCCCPVQVDKPSIIDVSPNGTYQGVLEPLPTRNVVATSVKFSHKGI